jgi:charged multivesicular body protein 4
MEDIVEHHEIANEITDVLSNSIGFGREINDDELMKELEQLEQLKLDEKLFYVKSAPMTELPATKVSKSKKQQDYDELVKLKSWIAC